MNLKTRTCTKLFLNARHYSKILITNLEVRCDFCHFKETVAQSSYMNLVKLTQLVSDNSQAQAVRVQIECFLTITQY